MSSHHFPLTIPIKLSEDLLTAVGETAYRNRAELLADFDTGRRFGNFGNRREFGKTHADVSYAGNEAASELWVDSGLLNRRSRSDVEGPASGGVDLMACTLHSLSSECVFAMLVLIRWEVCSKMFLVLGNRI